MPEATVHVFVCDSPSDWEIGYATAGLNDPQFQKDPGRYRIQTVALSQQSVVTAGGLRVQPDMMLAEVTPDNSAMLILPVLCGISLMPSIDSEGGAMDMNGSRPITSEDRESGDQSRCRT